MSQHAIELGDVGEVLRGYRENSFDALITDPPYGIGTRQPTLDELLAYLSGSELDTGGDFMGKDWHVPSVATWREMFRVLKPGAHALTFAGSRTGDLISLGLRAAGFEVRDVIQYMYGTGFPKSLNLEGEWEGYGTNLKPGYEPVILARKPLDGTVEANTKKWGVGALAIDACRIEKAPGDTNGWDTWDDPGSDNTAMSGKNYARSAVKKAERPALGRWPANVIFDEPAAALLDVQSGNRPGMSGGGVGKRDGSMFGLGGITRPETVRGDQGGASRFFYTVKASRKERDLGCESLPLKSAAEMTDSKEGQARLNSPRTGAGRTGGGRNGHPCVKPLALTEYLARLLLPPNPGAILVPFSGSGSEMIGALAAGWPAVLGIERESEYVEIAKARLKGRAA